MARYVQKFGGTSVASADHIQKVASIVAKAYHEGHQVVVVVSAMAGETDKLIALAKSYGPNPDGREYATLVSTGEQITSALTALALQAINIPAKSMTGYQAGIETNAIYKKARIETIHSQAIESALKEGFVVVVAGFQGADKDGNITTLGRGGSDTTAVAIAAAINADECQIFTDVDGIYTCDPRVVKNARRLEEISFEEMLELASLGAKVLQIRSVEFAGKYKVPLRVLSSKEAGPGTLISMAQREKMESPSVTGIAYSRHEAKITLSGLPSEKSAVATVLSKLAEQGVNTDTLLQHPTSDTEMDFIFTVHQDEYGPSMALLQSMQSELGLSRISSIENLAKVSVVGAGLKSHPEIAPQLFRTLDQLGINLQMITTSELKITVVIDNRFVDQAIVALHDVFNLAIIRDESKEVV
ncbi:aspartate kinase [Legionella sp. W05-934-2]|jgi:aspartate kinase|uniref:aspartate kinase n=1 Tax=Legionella sp. W05-934-2 TaxID=1198649 RepID=UPI003461EBD4